MPSTSQQNSPEPGTADVENREASDYGSEGDVANDLEISDSPDGFVEGMDLEGFAGPSEPVVKPLTPESLAAFKAAQDRAGVIYISRIPPGMRPAKVRHLMSAYGEIGRVYLQQEDAKKAYLRRKYTSTKKAHFTEGWVEFKDKKVARSVAEMLNAQPIGGKKGTRWRDDVWTMKYLPRFKWNMLTEQVAHEAAIHTSKLRVELQQSKTEQREYLKNVELARVLDKRAERKKEKGEEFVLKPNTKIRERKESDDGAPPKKRNKPTASSSTADSSQELGGVLNSIF
ncbi:RNA-binding ATPase activator esf2 [Pleurotus ostreatus]|nr:RNA-binding ATPase activator esf2 [Pleurotus ostreatus]